MRPDSNARVSLQSIPHTSKALEDWILAAEKFAANAGKTSLLGRDKSVGLYPKFLASFEFVVAAMWQERLIDSSMDREKQLDFVLAHVDHFQRAYPNWPRAYEVIGMFFARGIEDVHQAMTTAMFKFKTQPRRHFSMPNPANTGGTLR